jgi:acyl dehydratase
MTVEIRFDDIEGLKKQIRDDHGSWGAEVEITQAMINAFAELTGDKQWIHVDVERCKKESPFGGPIAHGHLTLSLLGKMRPPSGYTVVGYKNVTNYGSDGFRFVAPVPAGAKIHAKMRLYGVQQKPKGTLLESEVAVHVVGQEKPALTYKALVMYQG